MSQGDETCLSDTLRPIRGIFSLNEQRTLVAESEQVKFLKAIEASTTKTYSLYSFFYRRNYRSSFEMSSDIELLQLPDRRPSQSKIEHSLSYDQEEEVDESVTHHALPPVDGGRKAWSFLAGATVVEMLVWGFPYSIGILHVYWTNTLFKGYGESMVALAATLQTGLLYMSCAVFGP